MVASLVVDLGGVHRCKQAVDMMRLRRLLHVRHRLLVVDAVRRVALRRRLRLKLVLVESAAEARRLHVRQRMVVGVADPSAALASSLTRIPLLSLLIDVGRHVNVRVVDGTGAPRRVLDSATFKRLFITVFDFECSQTR